MKIDSTKEVAKRIKRQPENPAQRVAETYDELRQVAARLRRQLGDPTLQTTEVVHEAYIRLATTGPERYINRPYFFASADRAMRRLLVDRARKRNAYKRGADWPKVSLDAVDAAEPPIPAFDHVAAALAQLALLDPKLTQIVEMRFFQGYSMSEIATELRRGQSTVRRDCALAKAWLQRELSR